MILHNLPKYMKMCWQVTTFAKNLIFNKLLIHFGQVDDVSNLIFTSFQTHNNLCSNSIHMFCDLITSFFLIR